jgi:hypothetical protein
LARMTISRELGHGRIDVARSYVGSSQWVLLTNFWNGHNQAQVSVLNVIFEEENAFTPP